MIKIQGEHIKQLKGPNPSAHIFKQSYTLLYIIKLLYENYKYQNMLTNTHHISKHLFLHQRNSKNLWLYTCMPITSLPHAGHNYTHAHISSYTK